MGHGKKSCEGYKAYLRQNLAAAKLCQDRFKDGGKVGAASRMLADYHLDIIAHEMDDSELAEALIKEVWATFDIGSREGALISEAIERLKATPHAH